MPKQQEYDKHVDFYYRNLINCLILFSLNSDGLEKLAGPVFDPMFELESEFDIAYTPVCFETIFRNKVIDISFKDELLEFKQEIDNMSNEIWDWDFINDHDDWISIRQKANVLLDKLDIESRIYNDIKIVIK